MTGRRDRLIVWLVDRIPGPVVACPERVLLAVVMVLIGLDAVVLGIPASMIARAPRLLVLEFGVSVAVGGAAALVGMWRSRGWLEQAGHALIGLGCGIFVWAVVAYGGTAAAPVAVVYTAIAGNYGVRLLSQAAARIRLRDLLRDR